MVEKVVFPSNSAFSARWRSSRTSARSLSVAQLFGRRRAENPLEGLTAREREVLSLMAEGRSNRGICDKLVLSPKTVESHVNNIFTKLRLGPAPDDHRRVLAVLAFLK